MAPRVGVLLLWGVQLALADVYMQYPPGSNNRLDEGGGNRNNDNRLMDTQNNAKGGYGYGGDANNPAAPLKYMAGSKLSMSWTAQHSCGSANAECQMVIQYMCNDGNTAPAGGPFGPTQAAQGSGSGPVRDGTDNGDADGNANRGLHEPTAFYTNCANRERNKGLYTADQNVQNDEGSSATRQNPNGNGNNPSGQECPEERDYYPHWAPSPWKDLMIMTNNLGLCDFYRQNSQNVAERGYCANSNANNGNIPNNPEGCTQAQGTWTTVPAFGIPPPDCVEAPTTRDNHLGSDQTGMETMANLTIPLNAGGAGINDVENCVMRLRYNITTGDTRACSIKGQTSKAACEAAGGVWSAFYLDSSYNDGDLNSNPPLPDGNPDVNLGGTLNNGGGTDSLLELAINTNQYGRTFQDRTHVFSIQSMPAALQQQAGSGTIYNLNVKGKRGNIVQTYPATEYDFWPTDLVVGSNDWVHVQWTGNDNTQGNNGNNNGEGTNDEDRHNIVQLDESGLDVPIAGTQASMFDVAGEWNPEATGSQFGGARAQNDLVKQFALVKQTGCATNPNNDQAANNCQKLNAAAATVDLGLLRFKPGSYKYMSSRNNNFSNRAQKATLTTLNAPGVTLKPPTNVVAVNNGNGVTLTWSAPDEKVPYEDTNGGQKAGFSQSANAVAGYAVEVSCDGGTTWTLRQTNCPAQGFTCDLTPEDNGGSLLARHGICLFRMRSGSSGGWGDPSEVAFLNLGDGCSRRAHPGLDMGQSDILFTMTIDATVEQMTDKVVNAFKVAIAHYIGVPHSAVRISISPGSVKLHVTIRVYNYQKDTILEKVNGSPPGTPEGAKHVGITASAEAAQVVADHAGEQVGQTFTVTAVSVATVRRVDNASGPDAGVIAGAVIGSLLGVALIAAAIFFALVKHKQAKSPPPPPPPPVGGYPAAPAQPYGGTVEMGYNYAAKPQDGLTHNRV